MQPNIHFPLAILIAFVLWRIYDGLRARPQTNSISMAWHSVSFIFMFLLSSYVYYTVYGVSWQGWKPALALTGLCWVLADIIFNLVNRQSIFYAGDGKGSFLEVQFNKIARHFIKPLWLVVLLAKIIYISITISIVLIF